MLTAREAREITNRGFLESTLEKVELAAKERKSSVTVLSYIAETSWNMTPEDVSNRWWEEENALLDLGYTVEIERGTVPGAPCFEMFTMKVSW